MNEQKEREAFEACADKYLDLEDHNGDVNLKYFYLHNRYFDFDVQRAWRAWQARAALSTQSELTNNEDAQVTPCYAKMKQEPAT